MLFSAAYETGSSTVSAGNEGFVDHLAAQGPAPGLRRRHDRIADGCAFLDRVAAQSG